MGSPFVASTAPFFSALLSFEVEKLSTLISGMFDSLSQKLQNAFRNLRGLGKISETNVSDSLKEVRMALLEADVNFKVARDFIERVKAKSLGQDVIQSIQPGQQIIKILHDELVELLGSANPGLVLSGNPSCVLMVGLHGSGKTTSSGKLARLLHKHGRTPLLVAADVYRPAAMEQLETLGKQIGFPVFVRQPATPNFSGRFLHPRHILVARMQITSDNVHGSAPFPAILGQDIQPSLPALRSRRRYSIRPRL